MRLTRTSLAVAVSLSVTACGGGGGGGGGGLSSTLAPPVSNPVPFYAPVRVNSFQPNHQPYEYRTPLTEIYTQDLNNDQSDEVLWTNVAFEWTGKPWINSQVQIFGFNTGSFTNETDTWFAPGDNVYTGGFRVDFGDFNGNGFKDVFLTTFTDTPNHTGPHVMLENTGANRFVRREVNVGINTFSHDTAIADFNGDGIKDILTTGSVLILGSTTGNYTTYTTNQCHCDGSAIGSGISAADYLGDGSVTVVMTDGPESNGTDTILFRPTIVNNALVMQKIAELPADRFYLSKWDSVRAAAGVAPHAVRSITLDFNGDSRPDVVVFSTMPKDGNVHGYTEVQFLRNDGAGVFVDVTDSILTNFNHNKTVTYNPRLVDVNNDGLVDIFMSVTDFTGQSSTSVLLSTQEGKFVESYTHVFDAFSQQMLTTFGANAGTAQQIAIVAGPNNTRYFVSGVEYSDNGVAKIAVYASLIGTAGTVTPQATVDAVRQVWPWMSDAQANAVLAQSTTTWLNGVPILDISNVMNPVGGLGITLDGRTGTRLPIHGSISVPGMDKNLLKNVTAVDGLGRNFRVDLQSLDQQLAPMNIALSNVRDHEQSWSSKLVSLDVAERDGLRAAGDAKNWTTGGVVKPFGWSSPWSLGLTATQVEGSPWLNFSGVFGRVESSNLLEANIMRRWEKGYWAQVGGVQTSTNFTPGLVTDVSDIYSVFGVAGWKDQNWNLYGGVQPYVVSGKVTVDLPSGVDFRGTLHYTKHTVDMKTPVVTFAGASYQQQHKQHNWSVGGVVNSQKQGMVKFNYGYTF